MAKKKAVVKKRAVKKSSTKKTSRNQSPNTRSVKKKAKKTTKKKSTRKEADSIDAVTTQLTKLLDKPGSEKKILKLLLGLDESQRRKLFPVCQKKYRAENRDAWHEEDTGVFRRNPKIQLAQTALFCTATGSEIKKIGRWSMPDTATMLTILEARKPDWCDQVVDLLLNSSYYWNGWRLCRELVRRKLCATPENPRYYTGMITGLVGRWNRGETTVLRELKADPGLLKEDIWKLFEYEGDGDNTLANVDRWEKTNWSGSLAQLCREGKLSRPRLLDGALSALELGFNHYRARWFFQFFDRLEPTDSELKKRANRILDLMSNPAPNVAQWAFDKQQHMLQSKSIRPSVALVDANIPLLGGRHKKTVVQVLKLYEQIAKQSPKLTDAICLATADALAHEKADVQKSALKLIQKYGSANDPELRERVEQYQPLAAATVKKDVTAWLSDGTESNDASDGASSKSKPSATSSKPPFDSSVIDGLDPVYAELLRIPQLVESVQGDRDPTAAIESSQFNGTEIPRLDPERRIIPINDVDEWIETLGRVIEDDNLIDDTERAIDALTRLHADVPDDFEKRIGPLYKRAKKLVSRKLTAFGGQGMAGDICGLIITLVHGKEITSKIGKNQWKYDRQFLSHMFDEPYETWILPYDPIAFMSRRLIDVSNQVSRGVTTQLLSTPTHEGGWIDASILVERVNQLSVQPDETDVVMAMLRLAPDDRASAIKQWKPKLKGEWVNALKHALGGSGVRVGKSPGLWAAAARCREPMGDDTKITKAFPMLGVGAGQIANLQAKFREGGRNFANSSPPMPAKPPMNIPSQMLYCSFNPSTSVGFHDIGTTPGSIRGLASLWPSQREMFFAAGVNCLGSNIDWWEAEWHNRCFLEPLLDRDTPLLEMGRSLLLCGLASKEPGEHGLAVDITIQAIQDGRLGTDNLGTLLTTAIASNFFNVSRLAKRLTDISAVSELHAYVIMLALQAAVPSVNASKPPRGLGDLLELMFEIGTQLGLGVESETCKKYLGRIKGSGKAAKAAKNLLTIDSTFDPRPCIEASIVSRVERANTWSLRK